MKKEVRTIVFIISEKKQTQATKLPSDIVAISAQQQAQVKGGADYYYTCCRDKRRPTTIRYYYY